MDNTLRDFCNREVIGIFGTTCINTFSDDRLKFNEVEITNGLEVINQLTPMVYDKSKELNVNEDTFREAGLIAQEVLNTDLSFCVTGGDTINQITSANVERPYQVNYNDIIAYLISAIKELKTKNELLESENTLIKSKLNELLIEAGKTPI